MEEKVLRKTALIVFAMAAAILVCVFGGMKLRHSLDTDRQRAALNKAFIRNGEPNASIEILDMPYVSHSPESADFVEAGKKMGELVRDKENPVIAVVNDKYVLTENDVEMGLLLQEAFTSANNYDNLSSEELTGELRRTALTGAQTPAREEILQELIQNRVFVCEAEKRGIVVTDAQARAYINEQYALAEQALAQSSEQDRDHALRTRSLLNALVAGTGMSNEEYLREIQVPGIKFRLMIDRLYESYVSEVCEDLRFDQELIKEKYAAFEQRLLADADIKRLY